MILQTRRLCHEYLQEATRRTCLFTIFLFLLSYNIVARCYFSQDDRSRILSVLCAKLALRTTAVPCRGTVVREIRRDARKRLENKRYTRPEPMRENSAVSQLLINPTIRRRKRHARRCIWDTRFSLSVEGDTCLIQRVTCVCRAAEEKTFQPEHVPVVDYYWRRLRQLRKVHLISASASGRLIRDFLCARRDAERYAILLDRARALYLRDEWHKESPPQARLARCARTSLYVLHEKPLSAPRARPIMQIMPTGDEERVHFHRRGVRRVAPALKIAYVARCSRFGKVNNAITEKTGVTDGADK